ncbi:MAG: Fe-S cluster assembly protein SufD [Verrucomicrobiales bacterium]|nr:Fe-S cluster assembly protein SufD [Verrucomicrobiales bacterium]
MKTPDNLTELAGAADPVTGRFTAPFQHLADRLSLSGEPSWLLALRQAGLAAFAATGLPTTQDEDWRFTNLAPLRQFEFTPTLGQSPVDIPTEALDGLAFHELDAARLVFVDGHYAPALSSPPAEESGFEIRPLSEALAAEPGTLERELAGHAALEGAPFTALNQAYFTDGALVRVAAGRELAKPLHVLFVSSGTRPGLAVHPRNLILIGDGAAATIIEHYVGLQEQATLTNAVTELVVGDGARVEHLRFQEEAVSAFHFGMLRLRQGRESNVSAHSISLGARIFRHHVDPTLEGERTECVLNGLYLARGRQLADHHMVVDHARPNGASHEYFNGILADQARGVFHGRILVRPGAQKTDAKQTNKNILLSDDAQVNTKPQLEIYADDVKCTHGATIGQLDPDSIFYLRARGIPLETARRMLVHSFAGEITDRIRYAPAREEVDEIVWDWLEALEQVHIGRRDGSDEPVPA